MRIVSLRYRNESASVELETGESFTVQLDIALDMRLAREKDLSPDELIFLHSESAYFLCRQQAFRILSYRDNSSTELQRKLIEKKHDPDVVSRVLSDFDQKGYLDDRKYAFKYVESALRKKPKGPYLLKKELMERGIGRELAEESLREKGAYDIDLEKVYVLALKKKNSYKKDKYKEEKLTVFLTRRGFDSGTVFRVIKMIREHDTD